MTTGVHIIGSGRAICGKTDYTLRELILQSCGELFDKVNIVPEKIIVTNMAADQFTGQNHLGAFVADQLGLTGIPAMHVEAACGSGGVGVHEAFLSIKSGYYNSVLVVGVEKMTNVTTPQSTSYMAGASDFEWEIAPGTTFPGLNALIAKRYMHDYNVTEADLMQFSVISHKNAVTNPYAMFQKELSLEKGLSSRMIADPLKLFDCSPVSDGSAAVLLVNDELKQKNSHLPSAELVASRYATDTISLQERADLCELRASKQASTQAFKDAHITWKDIKAFEVHDAFTIMGALSLESFGIIEKGKAPTLAKEGQLARDGDIPYNTFGGLKARGHPVGSTGVYQVVENYLQLTEQAGKNQVPDINYALAQNIGGSGATISVNISKRS